MAVENGFEVTVDNTEAMLKAVKQLTQNVLMIGIPADSSREDVGPSNAVLGYIHEYGSPAKNIPPRPFLIPGVNSITAKAQAILAQAANFQLDNKPRDAQAALEAVGQMAADAVRAKIIEGPFAPLQPATLAARAARGNRGTKPLIDTTQMMRAVTWAIRKRGG